MADDRVDHVLVDIQLMQQLICLDAVLLRPQLKVDVVEHPDRAPEVLVLRVVFLRDLSHDLRHGLGVLKMERVSVILLDQISGLVDSGDVTHSINLLTFAHCNTGKSILQVLIGVPADRQSA